MFSSVAKLIKESSSAATSAAASVANSGITIQSINDAVQTKLQSYAPTEVYCCNSSCKKCISKTTLYGTLTSNNKCRICAKLFCSKCLAKTTFPVPNYLLNIEFKAASKSGSDEKESSKDTTGHKQFLCCGTDSDTPGQDNCLITAVNACMALLKEETESICGSNLTSYLINEDQVTCPFPSADVNDTYQMKAMRYSYVAAIVADISGFSAAYNAVKFLYMSSVGYNILLQADMFSVAGPMLESLKMYGITGPSALLRLYYLSCKHALQFKIDTSSYRRAALLQEGSGSGIADSTVLSATCPIELLEYISEFITPAQWLYIATLPSPYDDSKWNSWYLSRLIQRQGWTLLMCVNEATRLPNEQKCPAFAVVVRHRKEYGREVMLVIRGSKSTMDWAINFDEAVTDFQYHLSPTQYVQGHVHRGIHQGALGILDGYNLRPYLLDLVAKGYELTVVGHSLGAGTATLIAAELRNAIHKVVAKVAANQKLLKAVVFSSPAVVSESLADAFLQSQLVVNVVYGNDIVPRISRRNMATLAKEIIEFGDSPLSAEWAKGDQSDLYNYVKNMGKAAQIKRQDMESQPQLAVAAAAAVAMEDDKVEPSAPTTVDHDRHLISSEEGEESIRTAAAVSTVSSETEKKQLELEALQASAVILYTPGPIVHIFKEITDRFLYDQCTYLLFNKLIGAYDAVVLSHKHKTFERIQLLLEHAVEDHKMMNYRSVITAIQFVQRQRQTLSPRSDPSSVSSSYGASSSWISSNKKKIATTEKKVTNEIRTRQSIAADGVTAEGCFSPTAGLGTTSARLWRPCSVCELDVAWPYMMHSDANRSTVTHNCSICGGVVCSICAPAGDKIPGDGINQSIQLKDLRIAQPSLGIFVPQRVCIPCYFEEVLR